MWRHFNHAESVVYKDYKDFFSEFDFLRVGSRITVSDLMYL